MRELRTNKGVYNRVYCVFDKDKHDSFEAAKAKITASKPPNGATIHAITSTPCIEIWILLHFVYNTRSFSAASSGFHCALVVRQLRRHIPDYDKGNSKSFELVGDKINDAIQRAKRLDVFHQTSGNVNPPTNVHELVEYLI